MRDVAATAFERQFLAWLHIHLGVEPAQRVGPDAYWWTLPYKASSVSFVIAGQAEHSATPPAEGTAWLLRVEEDEGAGFVALVEAYFKPGSGVRRPLEGGRIRVQFASEDLVRQFEDQREATGLPSPRQAEPAAPANVAAERPADSPPAQMSADLEKLLSSQFSHLAERHTAANLKPCAAFMNKDGGIYIEALDNVDPPLDAQTAITRMSFRPRAGLRDGGLTAAAVFFHAGHDGERMVPTDRPGDHLRAIVGCCQHRSGEGVQMYWPYERSDTAPAGWKFDELQLRQSAGLPVLCREEWHFRLPPLGGGAIAQCAIDSTGWAGLVVRGDRTGELINLRTHEHAGLLMPPDAAGTAHALHAGRCLMLQGGADGQLLLHHFVSGTSMPLCQVDSGAITTCALSADGRFALAGSAGGHIIWCDLDWFTARRLRTHDGSPVAACACSPNGTRHIKISDAGLTSISQMYDDTPVAIHERESSLTDARMAAVSADGRFAVIVGTQLFVVWDLDRLASGPLTDAGAIIDACAISPNGQLLVLGLRSGVVRLWDECRGMTRKDVHVDDRATALAFSPDGGSVLVGHQSGAVGYLKLLDA